MTKPNHIAIPSLFGLSKYTLEPPLNEETHRNLKK